MFYERQLKKLSLYLLEKKETEKEVLSIIKYFYSFSHWRVITTPYISVRLGH